VFEWAGYSEALVVPISVTKPLVVVDVWTGVHAAVRQPLNVTAIWLTPFWLLALIRLALIRLALGRIHFVVRRRGRWWVASVGTVVFLLSALLREYRHRRSEH
jgi:hypothetical protein